MAFRVNDVPSKENYDKWKKTIREKELEVAALHDQNQKALATWQENRGKDNEKEFVDAYNKLQCDFLLKQSELAELKKGI